MYQNINFWSTPLCIQKLCSGMLQNLTQEVDSTYKKVLPMPMGVLAKQIDRSTTSPQKSQPEETRKLDPKECKFLTQSQSCPSPSNAYYRVSLSSHKTGPSKTCAPPLLTESLVGPQQFTS